jgi:hypothetical protein
MVTKNALILFLLLGTGLAIAQDYPDPSENEIVILWTYHGEPKRCLQSDIRIEQGGHFFQIFRTDHGISLTNELKELASQQDGRMTVHARCDGFLLDFPDVYTTWLKGGWEFGIDFPPYDHDHGLGLPERGTWMSYLDWYYGSIQWTIHDDPFPGLRDAIANRRPDDSDSEDKYADAYSKAVLGIEYSKSRDLLLTVFKQCAKRPDDFDPYDCSWPLADYLANLYWRGDNDLLLPLFDAAADKPTVLLRIGSFYGQLLARRPAVGVQTLGQISRKERETLCRRAGDEELWHYSNDVLGPLRDALVGSGAVGQLCWSAIESAEKEHGR